MNSLPKFLLIITVIFLEKACSAPTGKVEKLPIPDGALECIRGKLIIGMEEHHEYEESWTQTFDFWTIILTEAQRCNNDTDEHRLCCNNGWRVLVVEQSLKFRNYLDSHLDSKDIDTFLGFMEEYSITSCLASNGNQNKASFFL